MIIHSRPARGQRQLGTNPSHPEPSELRPAGPPARRLQIRLPWPHVDSEGATIAEAASALISRQGHVANERRAA